MRNHDYQDQLSHEQATNEHYIRVQEQKQARRRGLNRGIVTTPSANWTDTAPRTGRSNRRVFPLYGRVALTTADETLGTDYYIGCSHLEKEEMNVNSYVVCWVLPPARIFYLNQHSEEALPDRSTLAARRTFTSSPTDKITDYDDQLEDGVDSADIFTLPAPIEIPQAPPGSLQASPAILEDMPDARDEPDELTDIPPVASHPIPNSSEHLRAERLVRKSLDTPRTGHLPSVLNTLQPDQYKFVTWPADSPLLLQGCPGTGKTIIAAYRALYLTHPANKDRRTKRLALVGPTRAWTYHISNLLDSHVSNLLDSMEASDIDIECINLEDLIWKASQGPRHALHHPRHKWFKVDWNIYRLASRAVKKLEKCGQLISTKGEAMKQVLGTLITDTPIHRDLVRDRELSQWLLNIPSYGQARKWPDCLLLFAAISVALEQVNRKSSKPLPLNHYDHIIVDEAQDVRGIEWAILNQMITSNATWSIIGDMNQRRADYTFGSWRELIDQLETGDADVDREEVLTTGYRSTRQIMEFADNLIDQPSHWRVDMLRNGSEVLVERTPAGNLSAKVMEHVDHLISRYPRGTVAIIGTDLADIKRYVTRAGWRREQTNLMFHKVISPRSPGDQHDEDHAQRLMLADPIEARGLEFDAVVIVEPADFPTNLGRNGPLYTSLTRAHQELVVVHTQPLPKKLRRGARRSQRKARG